MNESSTYNIRRLGLRGVLYLLVLAMEVITGGALASAYGVTVSGEPHSGPQRYLSFLLEVTAGTVDTASKACVFRVSASPHCITSLLPFSACTLFWITLGPKHCGSRNMAL